MNTTLRMAYESTSKWNGSDRRCRRCVEGQVYFAVFGCVGVHIVTFGVIVISWVCQCFFFVFVVLFFLLFVFFCFFCLGAALVLLRGKRLYEDDSGRRGHHAKSG